MAGQWGDWFEREEFIGQISDIRVQNLQVERELVQKRTFTRWINLHLEKCDPPIEVHDLFRDIQDGHILMALLEELSGCKLLHGFKKSSHRIFRLNNIAKVLSFLEERNVKLVSIDAADVADGNPSIILGLIWNIILFFQIKELTGNIRSQFPSSSSLSSIPTSSDSDTSYCNMPLDERQSASTAMREHSRAIKKLLQWVQKRTRKYGVAVQDFGKSWTSGLAFLAVIKSIDPSLVDMRKALLRTAKENVGDSFRIAHYSLGIPRLLEPEDVTINAPDEHSIMTYVAQFLEHFPGIEEPEEPCQLIERSVSMGRLNFHDSDSHIRNGTYRSRVKERSYMFQRVTSQTPPKILISSVSEDRSAISPRVRPAATRSWSSEDFLADSSHMEDTSSSVAEEPNPASNSPQLSYTQTPMTSSVPETVNTESAIGDSAISSPDSWVESEFGVMPEKFCESRSDSSLCDSGTAWDVYRATPVEVTPLDEGFVMSIEDRAPDEQSITESCIDEGIYSLSSLESTQDRIPGNSEKKQVDVMNEKEANLEKNNQVLALKEVPGPDKAETPTEVDTGQGRELELFVGQCDLLETDQSNQNQLKQTSVEESTSREREELQEAVVAQNHEGPIESQNERNDSEEFKVKTECLKKDSLLEKKRGMSREETGICKEGGEGLVEMQDEASEGDQRESLSSETSSNTHPTNQDDSSKTSVDKNIPLIPVSTELEKQAEEGTCDPKRQGHGGDDDVHQAEGTDTDVNSTQNPQEVSCDSRDNVDKTSVEIPSCRSTALIESVYLYDTQMRNTEKKVIPQTSTDATCPPVNAEQEIDSTDGPEGHQDKLSDTFSTTQQNTLDRVYLKQTGISCPEPGSVSTDKDLFYTDFDQSSTTDDVVGDTIEPMDLFYPDKEEPMLTEPPDTEMQSWPSVLSVSALQPAPVSDSQPEQPLSLQAEDFRNAVDSDDKVITKSNQETDKTSTSQKQSLLPREMIGGLCGGDVSTDSSELHSSGSARENTEPVRNSSQSSNRPDENQIPPVLRHRKGTRFTQSLDNQRAVTAATRGADNADSDVWWSEYRELHLLLLLWLLLYCYWLLPQMDLKTLPSLLLNLHH